MKDLDRTARFEFTGWEILNLLSAAECILEQAPAEMNEVCAACSHAPLVSARAKLLAQFVAWLGEANNADPA